jgi:glycerol-3-phosphate cytidylyltransferase
LALARLTSSQGLRILTYGTFDTLHFGHLRLLRRAADLGNHLIVGLSTDEFTRIKGKRAFFNFEKRGELLKAVPYVDEIIPEISWEQKRQDILRNRIDIVTMGSDWLGDPRFEDLRDICQVIFLPYTFGISSTNIRQRLSDVTNDWVGSSQAVG